MPQDIDVAVYYFPNYHVDPRNEAVHGAGWTEWKLVKHAGPRFDGHPQPKVPAWGYEDESDPTVMGRKIDAAADHGLAAFIFDWYHYDDGPFLERGLEQGFLAASNNERLKFALMWANHDWVNIHPAKLRMPPPVLYPGTVTRETFDRIADLVIERYFSHPSYWRVSGAPYFSVYDLGTLLRGLGGVEGTKAALAGFREKTVAAGFPDLHLNAVVWGLRVLPTEVAVADPARLLVELGFTSATSYVWVHHVPLPDFPLNDYARVSALAADHWRMTADEMPVPYYPNVTMGWDPSPRTVQSDAYENAGYPFGPMLGENTPEAFRQALERVREFVADRPGPERIITINAWNEWTEGSYLEPDTVHGMAYLEAIREVFGASAN
jgi:hypothetical protein